MPSHHLILCCPLFLLPSVFPSIRVFSNELVLRIRWPKYWSFSFSISPSNEFLGLISFRMNWFDLLAVQGALKSILQYQRVFSNTTTSLISFQSKGLSRIFSNIQESSSTPPHYILFNLIMLFLKESESPQSSHFLYREIVNHKDELIDFPKVTEPVVTEQSLIFRYLNSCHMVFEMFHGGASGKEPICQCRRHKRHDSVPEFGRSPEGGRDNPLQYSCLENIMDRGTWQVQSRTFPRVRHD